MATRSLFWADGEGHGGPYTADEMRLLFDALFGIPADNEGVLDHQGGQLAVSTTGANQIVVQSGRAFINGTLFESDEMENLNSASPASGATGRLVLLRKDWDAKLVSIEIVSSPDGTTAIPAVTQQDGTVWEIPLASFRIATNGAISNLTDLRNLIWLPARHRQLSPMDHPNGSVTTEKLATGAVEENQLLSALRAKAWGRVNSTGTLVGSHYNVSSVVKSAIAGEYTINLSAVASVMLATIEYPAFGSIRTIHMDFVNAQRFDVRTLTNGAAMNAPFMFIAF